MLRLASIVMMMTLPLAACGPTIVLDDAGDSTGQDGTDVSTSTTAPPMTTETPMVTVTVSTSTTQGPPDTGEDVMTTTPPPPPPPDFGLPPGCEGLGELGEPCVEGNECSSCECFVVGPLGGVCSECDGDSDCEFGCNFGSPLTGMPAFCGDGSPGSGCQNSTACLPGLPCVPVVEIPGIIESSACSECAADVDCPGQQCAPLYFDDLFTGTWYCASNGTVPNGEGCGGNEECASGNCATAALMGIPVLTVCSECNESSDCPGACIPPEVEINGTDLELLPGFCA